MSRLRQFGVAFGIVCVIAGAAAPASASGGRHPLFDDQGTLTWYSSLDEAQAVARATGKLIFIDQGRLRCPNCRAFIEQVLPSSNIRRRISDIAIGLVDDADTSDPRIDRLLASGIASPTMLPLCGFVTPELKWSSGWSGYMDAGTFSGHVTLAEERYAQVQVYRRRNAPVAPAPICPQKAQAPAPPPAPARPVAPPTVAPPAPTTSHIGEPECEGGVCRLPSAKRPAVEPAPKAPLEPKTAPVAKVTPAPAPTLAKPTAPVLPATPPVAKLTPPNAAPTLPPATPAVPAPVKPAEPLAPATPPLAKAPPPAAPANPAKDLPMPSRATKPAGPVAGGGSLANVKPTPPPAPKPVASMARVRSAAAEGRWGEVLKLADEPNRFTPAEKSELDGYVRQANEWVQRSLTSAVSSAKERQFASARRTLTVLATQLDGTTCAGLIDAERGSRAVARLSAIEQGSPDQSNAPDEIRKEAYAEFRGTRWAPLFRGRP